MKHPDTKIPLNVRMEGLNSVWKEVLDLGTGCVFAEGYVQPGIARDSFYFILKGRVRLTYTSLDGHERVVFIMEKDNIFNEIPSLKTESRPGVGFKCIEDVEARRFPASLLMDTSFISSYPHLISNILQSMAIKTSLLFSHATEGVFNSTTKQLCRILVSIVENKDRQSLSQTDIAAILGVHQTTIARSVRALRNNRVIGKFTKNEIQILNLDRLKSIAEGRTNVEVYRLNEKVLSYEPAYDD
jgi:CRP/FNR family transcriptional regulator, cyclic AMP receptor protein